MIIAILSILIITLVVWLVNKKLPIQVCPVCAGVFLTWLWMFIGMSLGKLLIANYQLPVSVLMGGTVVGLMSKLEQFINPKFVLIWKVVFVVSGFTAVYSLITNQWGIFAIGVIVDIVVTLIFKTYGAEKENLNLKELKEKIKNCC